MTADNLRALANPRSCMVLVGALVWGAACQQQTTSPAPQQGEQTAAAVQPRAATDTAAVEAVSSAAAEQAPSGGGSTSSISPAAEPPAASVSATVESEADEMPAERLLAQADAGATSEKSPLQSIEQPPEPLLQNWKKPLVALVLTGEQQGYIEPCGCSERQSGGLARRADFVKQLKDRGWPVAGFDLGGTLKRTRRQSEMKFEYTRDGLNIMEYQALGLGPEELRLGALKLFESFSRTQADENFDVPFVSANVTFFGERSLGTPLEYRVVEVGGVKIGVTSVLGRTMREKLFQGGAGPDPSELKFDEVDDVLPAVIERMQAELGGDENSVLLLLSHAQMDESREIAAKYPQFDLVVTAGSPEDPDGRTEQIGDTLLLKVGAKGKHAGFVGVYPGDEFRFTTVELDRFRFGNAPEIDRLMERYQKLLEEENLIAREPPIRHPFGEGYEFLGSEKYAECHDVEYEIWKETPHAHGFDSLTVAYAQASDDPSMAARVRVDRIHDPECVNCHTTGWDAQDVLRFEGGFTGVEETPHLKGVNCENCHGPGSRHVELEESGAEEELLLAERKKMHLSIETAELQVCIKCHDFENSPDFDFETYWPQIEH